MVRFEAGKLCQAKGGAGSCEVAVCPQIFQPVCGLDGKTYGNACEAHAAHVVVAHTGECPRVCGGIAGVACPEGERCELPAGMCNAADLQGVCEKKPGDACVLTFRPLCGCDGKTYGNDCARKQAGVSLDHAGACERECRGNRDCARDHYCRFRTGTCGQNPGRCEVRPQVCTFDLRPVCGCDDKTYTNACQAAAAGVSVRADGACVK